MVFLSLGSNLGDREANIRAAVAALQQHDAIEVRCCSSLYETQPFGVADQGDFLNAALGLDTTLSPFQLLEQCLCIEQQLGRVREEKWGPRIIDIDILTYYNQLVDSEQLIIPHSYLIERKFVLVPLTEISGDRIIAAGQTAGQLLASLNDSLAVTFYKRLSDAMEA